MCGGDGVHLNQSQSVPTGIRITLKSNIFVISSRRCSASRRDGWCIFFCEHMHRCVMNSNPKCIWMEIHGVWHCVQKLVCSMRQQHMVSKPSNISKTKDRFRDISDSTFMDMTWSLSARCNLVRLHVRWCRVRAMNARRTDGIAFTSLVMF